MKLFLRSILSLTAITAFAPLASAQTPLYYQGGIQLNNFAENPVGPGDEDFNNPANWNTEPPNTFNDGSTSVTFPGPTNIAVVQADLNDGTVFYTEDEGAFISNQAATPVVIKQTSQANSVAGFIVSNFGFFGIGSGNVTFANTSNRSFTVNGTNAAGGDFVVDGGVTLTYTGNSNASQFVVNGGTIVIGDDENFIQQTANNTVQGSGTFKIASGLFTYDTAANNPTQMIVGYSTSTGNQNEFFIAAVGSVIQGAAAQAATSTTAATPATSSTVTLGSSLTLGQNFGTGSWSVTNGSLLQTGSAGSSYTIDIGSSGGTGGLTGNATGTLTISDSSSFDLGVLAPTVTTKLEVGTVSTGAGAVIGGSGTIIQNGAASTVDIAGSATQVDIGGMGNSLGGGTGRYTMTGGTLLIGNTSINDAVIFNIGFQVGSTGTLTQSGGSTLIEGVNPALHGGASNATTFTIGGNNLATAGSGTYTLSGAGTTATFYNGIKLGNTGVINVNNGATLTVAQNGFTGQSGTAGGNGTTDIGTLNLGGGTLKLINGAAAAYTYNFAGALNGGVAQASTIDVTGANLTSFTFGHALTGTGGINLVGSGTTVFTFAAGNTYTGSTGISGGSLAVTGAELADGVVGSQLIFGSSGAPGQMALPGILNVAITANTTLNQSITGSSGTINVNYGGAGQTLSFISANNTSTGVSIVLGNNGTAGGLVIGSGTYASVNGSNGAATGAAASTVEIGGNGTGGTVTFGTTGYDGLTKVDSGFNLVVTNGNLTGSVDDSAGSGNLTVAGQVGMNAASTIANGTGTISSGSILGDVTANAGLINTPTITGNVQANSATGTIVAPSISGNIVTNAGMIQSLGTGIGGNILANTGTITTTLVGGTLNNTGTFIGASALGATTVVGNVTNNVGGTLESSTPLPTVAPPAGPALPANATFTTTGALDSSGTVVVRTNGVTSDSYFATGNLTIEPGSIIKLTGFGNNSFNVFNSTAGVVSVSPAITISSTTLYSGTISPTGVLTTVQIPSANFSLTPTQRNVAMSIDRYLSGSIPVPAAALADFNAFNNVYSNLSASQFPAVQEQLSPEVLQYARNIAYENATYLATKANAWDADLREGYEGLDTSAVSVANPGFESGMGRSLNSMLAYNDPGFHSSAPNGVNYYPGESGQSSPSPIEQSTTPAPFDSSNQVISDSPNPYLANVKPGSDETPRLNEFIGGDVVLADLNQNAGQGNNPSQKANYTAGDVTAGVSFRVTNHFAAGVLFDYNHTDADTDSSGSKTKIDTYSPGIFATYFDKGFYVNGLFSFGYNDYKNTRNISTLGSTATSSPSGQQYVTDLDFGYDFHPDKQWVVGPTLGATYTHLDVDSFQESGAGLPDLDVNSQSTDSVRSRLGGHLIYQTNTGDVLLQPNLTAMWQHEFLANSDNITSSFSELGGASTFYTPTSAPSRDSALIGVGLTATLNNSLAFYLNYMADVGADDFFTQTVMGGVKARF